MVGEERTLAHRGAVRVILGKSTVAASMSTHSEARCQKYLGPKTTGQEPSLARCLKGREPPSHNSQVWVNSLSPAQVPKLSNLSVIISVGGGPLSKRELDRRLRHPLHPPKAAEHS